MANNKPRTGERPLRGEALDEALTRELERMVAEGADVSPISLAAVARRLELGSRTTLYEPARLERIRAARLSQNQSLRATVSAAQSSDAVGRAQSELQQLRQKLNELRTYIVQIAINAHRMGLQPERLLAGSQREIKSTGTMAADQLAVEYLSRIGLLGKLDANVRALGR